MFDIEQDVQIRNNTPILTPLGSMKQIAGTFAREIDYIKLEVRTPDGTFERSYGSSVRWERQI